MKKWIGFILATIVFYSPIGESSDFELIYSDENRELYLLKNELFYRLIEDKIGDTYAYSLDSPWIHNESITPKKLKEAYLSIGINEKDYYAKIDDVLQLIAFEKRNDDRKRIVGIFKSNNKFFMRDFHLDGKQRSYYTLSNKGDFEKSESLLKYKENKIKGKYFGFELKKDTINQTIEKIKNKNENYLMRNPYSNNDIKEIYFIDREYETSFKELRYEKTKLTFLYEKLQEIEIYFEPVYFESEKALKSKKLLDDAFNKKYRLDRINSSESHIFDTYEDGKNVEIVTSFSKKSGHLKIVYRYISFDLRNKIISNAIPSYINKKHNFNNHEDILRSEM